MNDAKASLGEVRNQVLHARDERLLPERDVLELLHLADRAIGAATSLQRYLRRCPRKFDRQIKKQTAERRDD